jgi:hypothetical protein
VLAAVLSRCGLGSEGTDRIVELVREEAEEAAADGQPPALYGAKITGGGCGGAGGWTGGWADGRKTDGEIDWWNR